MGSYSARALVLQRTKLGESDLILTMLSESGEIVRAVAKGARKPKSRLGSAAGLFRCNDWLLHEGRNLDIVTEARSVETHSNLSSEYRAALAAGVMAEFVAKTHLPGQCDPRIFDMTMVAMLQLDEMAKVGRDDPTLTRRIDALLLAYLVKSLAMHGYRPSTATCAECGLPVDACEDSVEWSADVAGVVCEDCAPHTADSRLIPAAASSWIGFLLQSTLSDVASSDIAADAIDDLFDVVNGLIQTHVQTRIKSLEVYRAERSLFGSQTLASVGLDEPPMR